MRGRTIDISATNRALLATSELLEGVSPDRVGGFLRRARGRHFEEKEFLFQEGEPIDGLYLVIGGQVKLTKTSSEGAEVIVALLEPPEVFVGVAGLPAPRDFPVSAEALTELRVAFWERAEAQEAFEAEPLLHRNLVGIIASRARVLQDRFRDVATERVPARLARMLLRLSRQCGREVDDGTRIEIPLTRRDLAEMVGTTLYTVSRQFSEWTERGWLRTEREGVVVLDPDGLADLAGWERQPAE